MNVIYFDPEYGGHHLGHTRIFADRAALDPRIERMHFLLDGALQHVDDRGLLAAIGAVPKFSVEFASPEVIAALGPMTQLGSRKRGMVRWGETRRALTERPGWIFYHSLIDDALFGAALDRTPLPGLVSGIVHFCAPAVADESFLRRWKLRGKYFFSRRREIPLLFTFDARFPTHGPGWIVSHWRTVVDPLPLNDAQVERLFSLGPPPASGPLRLLVFGAIGPRKGVFTLLEALARLDETLKPQVRLRVLGRFTEGAPDDEARFRVGIDRARAAGVTVDYDARFASEDEIIDALEDAHVVIATYEHHQGTSSVLVWAAASGRPVITQNTGWMGATTLAEGLGAVCDPLDPDAVAAAIAAQFRARAAHRPDAPRAFARRQTSDAFYETIVSGLHAVTQRRV